MSDTVTAKIVEPTIFELSQPGRTSQPVGGADVPERPLAELLPGIALRASLPLPEVTEVEVTRHFTHLSQLNYSVDTGLYPLGSCTMKYNPKVNEETAALSGFAAAHPYLPEAASQGALRLMWELQSYLAEIGGMDACTLQPSAGAQGELSGMLMVRAYHRARGEDQRHVVLVPDSAHGTNPASAAMVGYRVQTVASNERGGVDLEALRARLDGNVAAFMITIPNTLGLFDENICEIARLVHEAGGLVYADGANMNAVLGRAKLGQMGCDVMHFNLHKTFSTPHGGGGPGAGPVAVKAHLAPFLPLPQVARREEVGGREVFYLDCDRPQSIGRVRSFYGNFGVLVRAYTYIRSLGAEGLRAVSENAVLNANYLLSRLRQAYDLPYDRRCMHEFVLSGRRQKAQGARTLDIAKRIIDYGFYPPTIYFPLIVEEALMIEPTETESKQTLDSFVEAMLAIAAEAQSQPELLREAPHHSPVGRLDETRAARQPVLKA
ncbi:MAG: aminomethyl-transferring glycine dehydrogenase subunit GcvPB [Chloroflexota bacterium]